jgi:hypothetical protein
MDFLISSTENGRSAVRLTTVIAETYAADGVNSTEHRVLTLFGSWRRGERYLQRPIPAAEGPRISKALASARSLIGIARSAREAELRWRSLLVSRHRRPSRYCGSPSYGLVRRRHALRKECRHAGKVCDGMETGPPNLVTHSTPMRTSVNGVATALRGLAASMTQRGDGVALRADNAGRRGGTRAPAW